MEFEVGPQARGTTDAIHAEESPPHRRNAPTATREDPVREYDLEDGVVTLVRDACRHQ